MIGVLGGYGNIGQHAVDFLKKHCNQSLRIGGRNCSKVDSSLKESFGDVNWMNVDADNEEDLKNFFMGCSCILDATSLNEKSLKKIDDIADGMNIPVVHLGINGFRRTGTQNSILYGAGSIPGLSGLIPQFLAQDFNSVEEMDFRYGTCSEISPAAAKDYMEGIFSSTNHSMVYWNQGSLEAFIPAQDSNDFFDKEFSHYKFFPYFDEESMAIAQKIHLGIGKWQMCLVGKNTLHELESARSNYMKDPKGTIKKICLLNKMDLFGVTKNTLFYCAMKGEKNGEKKEALLVLSGIEASRLTGICAAAATISVMESAPECIKTLLGETDHYNRIIELIGKDPGLRILKRNTTEATEELEGEI